MDFLFNMSQNNGNFNNENFLRKEDLEILYKKRKSNGTIMPLRKEMIIKYNNSNLPYPFSVIFNLNYCKNIIKSHLFNCVFFSIPLSSVAAYTFNTEIRNKGFMSKNKSYYLSIYLITYGVLLGFFTLDALLFCDYCKPWSDVYLDENRTDKYKKILKGRIKGEYNSLDIQIKKTRDFGLKDEEI